MLTEERDTTARPGKTLVRGVAAGVKIYAGALTARNAAGFAVPAADAAGLVVEGRALSTVDNTAGQNGDLQIEVEQGCFLFTSAGLTAADAGKDCYAVSDEAVDLTGGTNKVFAGVIVEVASATEAWVRMGADIKKTRAAAVVAAVAAADATVAGAAYDQTVAQSAVTLGNANKAAINAILTALKASGQMANS